MLHIGLQTADQRWQKAVSGKAAGPTQQAVVLMSIREAGLKKAEFVLFSVIPFPKWFH